MTLNTQDLRTLADKLNGLELTAGERDALESLITGRAEELEVGGFGRFDGPVVLGLEIHNTATYSVADGGPLRPQDVAFCYQKVTWT